MQNEPAPATSEGLLRCIRRWDLVALAINSLVGAGIFGLPSKVFALAGVYSIGALLAGAVVITLVILCFAEVSSRFTQTGGPYLYAREAFGPLVGFEVGWLLWLARLTGFAAVCNLLVDYLGYFAPELATGLWRVTVICGVIALLTAVHLAGVRNVALVSNVFTVAKLLPLLLFVGVGIFFLEPSRFQAEPKPDGGAFWTAVLVLLFAFSGFETTVITGGEVRDPQRSLPFALLTALGIVAVLYLLIQIVCIGTLPGLAESTRPLADAAGTFLGGAGGGLIAIGALVSVSGTLNAILLAVPRLPFAMAEQGQLPRWFAAVHPRFHTPHAAILFSAVVLVAISLYWNFLSAVTISTIIRLAVYGATCAALPVLRRQNRLPAPGFRVPAGMFVAMAATGLCLWLIANSTWREGRDAGIAAVIGLILYAANKRQSS